MWISNDSIDIIKIITKCNTTRLKWASIQRHLNGYCVRSTIVKRLRKFFSIYGLKIAEILFELKDFNDNELNGVLIYIIPPLDGSDTDKDSKISMKKIVCAVSVKLAVSNERLSLWINYYLQHGDKWDSSD